MTVLEPLIGKLVVLPDAAEKETEGGILLPDSATEQPQAGAIVALSDGWFESGELVRTSYKVGDRVMFGRFSGTDFESGDKEYKLLRFTDLFGRLVSE